MWGRSCSELKALGSPVNQRIVVVEPTMSQNSGDTMVELRDEEVKIQHFPGGELDRNTRGMRDRGGRRAVEEGESTRRNNGGLDGVKCYKVRIDKVVRRPRVDQGSDERK